MAFDKNGNYYESNEERLHREIRIPAIIDQGLRDGNLGIYKPPFDNLSREKIIYDSAWERASSIKKPFLP